MDLPPLAFPERAVHELMAREFAQLRTLARHQLVYRTLGELVGREIHALSIEALSPDEALQKAPQASFSQ